MAEPRNPEPIDVSERLTGPSRAASFHVAVFDTTREKIHCGHGGVDLIERMKPVAGRRNPVARRRITEMRGDLFQHPTQLRDEAIPACGPFLPPLDLERGGRLVVDNPLLRAGAEARPI